MENLNNWILLLLSQELVYILMIQVLWKVFLERIIIKLSWVIRLKTTLLKKSMKNVNKRHLDTMVVKDKLNLIVMFRERMVEFKEFLIVKQASIEHLSPKYISQERSLNNQQLEVTQTNIVCAIKTPLPKSKIYHTCNLVQLSLRLWIWTHILILRVQLSKNNQTQRPFQIYSDKRLISKALISMTSPIILQYRVEARILLAYLSSIHLRMWQVQCRIAASVVWITSDNSLLRISAANRSCLDIMNNQNPSPTL